jgi:hypothetical protein
VASSSSSSSRQQQGLSDNVKAEDRLAQAAAAAVKGVTKLKGPPNSWAAVASSQDSLSFSAAGMGGAEGGGGKFSPTVAAGSMIMRRSNEATTGSSSHAFVMESSGSRAPALERPTPRRGAIQPQPVVEDSNNTGGGGSPHTSSAASSQHQGTTPYRSDMQGGASHKSSSSAGQTVTTHHHHVKVEGPLDLNQHGHHGIVMPRSGELDLNTYGCWER